jgi:hypothetical protein
MERKKNGDPKKIYDRFENNWNHLNFDAGSKLPKHNHRWKLTLIPKDVVVIDTGKPKAHELLIEMLKDHKLYNPANISKPYGALVANPVDNTMHKYKAHFWFKCIPSDEMKELIPSSCVIDNVFGMDMFNGTYEKKGGIVEHTNSRIDYDNLDILPTELLRKIRDRFIYKPLKNSRSVIKIQRIEKIDMTVHDILSTEDIDIENEFPTTYTELA